MATRSPAVTEAISALLVQQPFFASLLIDLLEIVETDTMRDGSQLNTCCCDGKTLRINPTAFAKWTVPERIGVLAHEIMHVILQHPHRGAMYQALGVGPDLKKYSHKRMNHAADYIINAHLTSNGFKLPLGSLQNSQITGDDVMDEVYCKLPDDEEDKDDNFDEHETAENGAAEDSAAKANMQAAVQKAKEVAKMMGKGCGGLERLIDEICQPQISWAEHLRRAIMTQTRGRDVYTWARPNRRKLAAPPHIYWPGRSGLKGPHVAVEIDTSGSIGDDELKVFMGELSGILTDVQPEMVYVMYVDDALHGDVIEVDDVNDLLNVAKKAGGGGGTDMTTVFKEIAERQLPVETVVVLTDGYTPFGEDTGIPTIWCMTSDQVAPWGTTVKIDMKK